MRVTPVRAIATLSSRLKFASSSATPPQHATRTQGDRLQHVDAAANAAIRQHLDPVADGSHDAR